MRLSVYLLCVALSVGCGSANNADVDASGEATCSCPGAQLCVAGQCVPGNCADGALSGNETDIDCGGDCLACSEGQPCLGALDCSSKYCSDSGLCTDCMNPADCEGAPGTFCDSGVCRARIGLGEACDTADECSSGYCVDGKCCDGPCDGACEECSGSGVCDFVAAGEDSAGDCLASAEGTCGLSGACDGSGGCAFRSSDVGCDLATCGGGGQGICDGAGSCDPNGAVSCDPYVCSGDGMNCLVACVSDDDCVSSHYCSPGGACLLRASQGGDCDAGNQCLTGFCADGKCCNSTCVGTCKSCSTGTCSNIDGPSTVDCGDPSPPCGNTGECNGSGACEQYASGTPCANQTCSNGQQTAARTCNGSGLCSPGNVTSCTPYECNGASCHTSCTGDAQCQSGYGCVGGDCVVQKDNGVLCGGNSECASGNCVEGRCCNSACTGTCQSCLASKTDAADGTCANVTGGTDPDNECSAQASSTCGRTGVCSGTSAACELWASGTSCGTTTCGGTDQNRETTYTCNGAGTCNGSTITCPGHLKCVNVPAKPNNECATTCQHGGCVWPGDYRCEGSTCVPTFN